ncbi:serine hydrolase [Phytoactinopolyspora alkaliphila]|uniref:Serine hydrolase n=1 Tax=Phytoactinopolyspora alkaliphila TaxID=1783498 RepID=A0A6N9YMY0_9ACTN|nr:serine hydrolase [Phytoactinopolyspora alkaliphila]NED96270.1 serine hydrolase [Phytoactinopolyspora alkaliphila]
MTIETEHDVVAQLDAAFSGAGVSGYLHAAEIDGAADVGYAADELVVTASVFKIYVLLELCCQAAEGRRSLTDRVRFAPEARTPGPTGLSVMYDEIDMSVRDAAYLMMSVSDNHATDVLMGLAGVDDIHRRLRALGLPRTAAPHTCAELFRTMAEDLLGTASFAGLPDLFDGIDDARLLACRALTPAMTNRTTARETTSLLGMIWRDENLPAGACAETRRIMGLQVWPHRLTSGFPDHGIRVSGKTGTLSHVRNEVGVVEYPDGGRYAVAVYLRVSDRAFRNPAADAVIGQAARIAVDHLRSS